jgi:hypothetical protein
MADTPTPKPAPPEGKAFHTPLGDFTYSWVELGPDARRQLNLDNAAEHDGTRNHFWSEMEEGRDRGKTVAHAGHLYFGRAALDPKKYEYFVLVRDPQLDEHGRPRAVTGRSVLQVRRAKARDGQLAIEVRMNAQGAMGLADLRSKSKGQKVAIILEELMLETPTLGECIDAERTLITGNFATEEADRVLNILKSGSQVATLKPGPVSETTVLPAK